MGKVLLSKDKRMERKLYKNGFIIKAYLEQEHWEMFGNYSGIGRYLTWPLEELTDDVSVSLTKEAWKRWFGYKNMKLCAVPDLDYLQRYKRHCSDMNISAFCLQIESMNAEVVSSVNLPIIRTMGFDYADADMQTSCLYEDLTMDVKSVVDSFKTVLSKLNRYGLIDSMDTMQHYLTVRKKLIEAGYDMEEYYCPTIVRLCQVLLNEE